MTKKMLIDAAHPEETRVAVIDGTQVEDFDFETSSRQSLRGDIYLARVTRIEPSLQAAFVEYGGNRHGFLAFSEIHPDYYQIPVSDREKLLEAERAGFADEEEEKSERSRSNGRRGGRGRGRRRGPKAAAKSTDDDNPTDEATPDATEAPDANAAPEASDAIETPPTDDVEPTSTAGESAEDAGAEPENDNGGDGEDETAARKALDSDLGSEISEPYDEPTSDDDGAETSAASSDETEAVAADDAKEGGGDEEETNGEDAGAEDAGADDEKSARGDADGDEDLDDEQRMEAARRRRIKLLRRYRIQEVIKRRQILLVQVVKDERGTKGAALTTYLSLAGRYCVLMPNTARGGGISRKITTVTDRKRLRTVVDSLEVPAGMGLIIRTAGAKRTKTEIKRDYEYLLRLWENIRELTLKSIAPTLIYEEASLIKRAIRDLYDKDIEKVLVEGEEAYREAKDFMRMLVPSHAKFVQPHKDNTPIFLKHKVEEQLDGMFNPSVKLKSGGYIVINQTEALVAIDVNSGRATRERNVEQTALKTNLEAAEEAARQFRLRDLAGLIVIDFIDMEEARNNRAVEKKFKDCLKTDRARIQTGRISNFGLLEMSRQRRRSGLTEGIKLPCPSCHGAGVVRSVESMALRVLRALEAEGVSGKAGQLSLRVPPGVAAYVLNKKRARLNEIERNWGVEIDITPCDDYASDQFEIEKRGEPKRKDDSQVIRMDQPVDEDAPSKAATAEPAETTGDRDEDDGARRKRGRRGREKRKPDDDASVEARADASPDAPEGETAEAGGAESSEDGDERKRGKRRRGRRGGRRARRRSDTAKSDDGAEGGEASADLDASRDAAQNDEKPQKSGNGSDETDAAAVEQPVVAIVERAAAAASPAAPDDEPDAEDRDLADAEQPPRAADSIHAEIEEPDEDSDGTPRRGWWRRAMRGEL